MGVSVVARRKNQPRGVKESQLRSVGLPKACGVWGHLRCGNMSVDV